MRRARSAILFAAPVLLLLASAGCKQTSEAPDAGTVTNTGQCSVDAECKSGFRCDRELLRCVCTSDASCPAPLLCNAFTGQCVDASQIPGCTTDADCTASQYCDVPTRTCHARRAFCEPCESDAACGTAADRCVLDPTLNRRFCGQACQDATGCPDGTTCQTVDGAKTCWPAVATCEQLVGCNPNTGQSCTTDADCTEGQDQVCDQVQNACMARLSTCPLGMVCNRETSQCEAACTTDGECAADPVCQGRTCRCTNNECVPVLECTADSECESGKVCIVEAGQTTGECGPSCTQDADCPQDEVCTDTGTRGVCSPGCTDDADCAITENCDQGHCVAGCQNNDVCDDCQRCLPVSGTGRSECQDVGSTYCATCASTNCTQIGQNWCCGNQLRIDCSTIPCPHGFECAAVLGVTGAVVGRACRPLGSTCQEPGCQ